MHTTILNFIKHFSSFGPQVTECFTCGNCYWFAQMLLHRFQDSYCYIVYDEVANHFGCAFRINGDTRVFDITGDVTIQYNWEEWSIVVRNDPILAQRIRRDCIDF